MVTAGNHGVPSRDHRGTGNYVIRDIGARELAAQE